MSSVMNIDLANLTRPTHADCLELLAASCGTLPFQVQIGAVGHRRHWLPVADLDSASRACRQFIESNDLGASAWRGGQVVESGSKKVVATVSYNGRVRLADGREAHR